jgi:Zn-dependent peptidase ImmA (M78 family)
MIKKINIAGLDYDIKEVPVIDKDNHLLGQIDYVGQVILIDSEQTEQRKEQTLFHEILHGVLEQTGLSELNEDDRKVQSISVALHQTLKPFISF